MDQCTLVTGGAGYIGSHAVYRLLEADAGFVVERRKEGLAAVAFTAPAVSGTYTYVVEFPGDQTYGQASDSDSVTVVDITTNPGSPARPSPAAGGE